MGLEELWVVCVFISSTIVTTYKHNMTSHSSQIVNWMLESSCFLSFMFFHKILNLTWMKRLNSNSIPKFVCVEITNFPLFIEVPSTVPAKDTYVLKWIRSETHFVVKISVPRETQYLNVNVSPTPPPQKKNLQLRNVSHISRAKTLHNYKPTRK